jgi:integrase
MLYMAVNGRGLISTSCVIPIGCSRDACIILMMARLGMRAGEVRQLKLDDIDWIDGAIHVRAGKSRRERTLPLLEEVGKALDVYLREEGPESAERSIFLTLRPPYRPVPGDAGPMVGGRGFCVRTRLESGEDLPLVGHCPRIPDP